MRFDVRFVLVTAALYAAGIGWSVYEGFWTCAPDNGWSCYAAGAGRWSALVFAASTAWLALRGSRRSSAWLAAHAAAAWAAGIVAGWLLLELRMRGSAHGWEPGDPVYECLVCPRRAEGIRLAALALVAGVIAAAALAPALAAAVRRLPWPGARRGAAADRA